MWNSIEIGEKSIQSPSRTSVTDGWVEGNAILILFYELFVNNMTSWSKYYGASCLLHACTLTQWAWGWKLNMPPNSGFGPIPDQRCVGGTPPCPRSALSEDLPLAFTKLPQGESVCFLWASFWPIYSFEHLSIFPLDGFLVFGPRSRSPLWFHVRNMGRKQDSGLPSRSRVGGYKTGSMAKIWTSGK